MPLNINCTTELFPVRLDVDHLAAASGAKPLTDGSSATNPTHIKLAIIK
jgi:hypothetical protein